VLQKLCIQVQSAPQEATSILGSSLWWKKWERWSRTGLTALCLGFRRICLGFSAQGISFSGGCGSGALQPAERERPRPSPANPPRDGLTTRVPARRRGRVQRTRHRQQSTDSAPPQAAKPRSRFFLFLPSIFPRLCKQAISFLLSLSFSPLAAPAAG